MILLKNLILNLHRKIQCLLYFQMNNKVLNKVLKENHINQLEKEYKKDQKNNKKKKFKNPCKS